MSEQNNDKKDLCVITPDSLDLSEICKQVGDPSCGAISTFIGVTRNHFNNKKVIKLEYEAYKPMAEKELLKICRQVREKWDVHHIAMYHKTGLVPIGEASVIIAISSVHRDTGLEAVHWAIDELKATVPIWKKEFYEDGSVWKGNAECRHVHKKKQHHDPKDSHEHKECHDHREQTNQHGHDPKDGHQHKEHQQGDNLNHSYHQHPEDENVPLPNNNDKIATTSSCTTPNQVY